MQAGNRTCPRTNPQETTNDRGGRTFHDIDPAITPEPLRRVHGGRDAVVGVIGRRRRRRELLDAALEGRPLLTRRVARSVAGLMSGGPSS